MEEFDVYKDISERTNGDIYIGVVGPVRSGKSTFITNFMQKLVLPLVKSDNERTRMQDELPQSASGKTIMTTQPKFVPGEAVKVSLGDTVSANVRLIDCVGYLIDGAMGETEGDKERMVKTPWSDKEMPFNQAADIGTKKVIADHSTIGIVMTTDGSIATEIPRKSYVDAEERCVNELIALNKPFVVILNSTVPDSEQTKKLAAELSEKYSAAVLQLDVLNLTGQDIENVFKTVLMEFPLKDVEVECDEWIRALPIGHEIVNELTSIITAASENMTKMSDYMLLTSAFEGNSDFKSVRCEEVALGCGRVRYSIQAEPKLFYSVLSKECDMELNDDYELMASLKGLVKAKKEYDRLAKALEDVRENGYGVVPPTLEEMTLDEPEIVKQGGKFGVKLRASAPSLHIMRVDIDSVVSPIVGTEQQSEELVNSMLKSFEDEPNGIWQTDIFGKSLNVLVNEGLSSKLNSMREDTQKKMRRTLSRIINEGKGGVICILL